jgi:hypothetical protein
MADHVRVELGEKWEDVSPHLGSEITRVDVRRIVRERHVVASDVPLDLCASCAEERAKDGDLGGPAVSARFGCARARREDTEASRACTAEQTEEERFGSVVGVMRGGDRRVMTAGGGDESFPADFSRPCLHVSAGRYVDARAREGNAEFVGVGFRNVELTGGGRSEPVVDAVRHDPEPELAADASKHLEEGHRVGTAADGRHERAAGWESTLAGERASHERRQ